MLTHISDVTPQSLLPELDYQLTAAYDIEGVHSWQQRTNAIDVCYSCWYIRKGEASIIEENQKYTAGPGNWVFSEPFRKRTQRFATGTHLVSVRFKVRWGRFNYVPPLRPVTIVPHSEAPDLLKLAETLATAEEYIPNEISAHCLRQSHFYLWLSRWHAIRTPELRHEDQHITDLRIQTIIDILNDGLGLGVIDYPALKEATLLSRAQIDRLFKEQLDLTPRQWCERQCLFQAEEWLRETNFSIKEIASRLRFSDQSHFAKWFRKQTGHSPQGFRKEIWI